MIFQALGLLPLLLQSTLFASPARKLEDMLSPAPGQHVLYEGKATISQEAGSSVKSVSERSTTLSYVVFPGKTEAETRMLLLRSVSIRLNDLPLPGTNEALLFSIGKGLEATLSGDTPEEPLVSTYEFHLPSVLFPRFELPEKLEKESEATFREEDVKILGVVVARFPVQVTVEKVGSTLKVTRRLQPGKTAKLDFDGSPSTLEAWSETHTMDLERRIVSELRREITFFVERGAQKFRTMATHELKAKAVRLLDPAERERAAAVEQGFVDLLDDFRAKKAPRDIYSKIQALEGKEGMKLFAGLSEALLTRFASYRQGLEGEARENKSNASTKSQDAPDFTLEGLDGKSVSFREATRGKVVLLSFWGYG